MISGTTGKHAADLHVKPSLSRKQSLGVSDALNTHRLGRLVSDRRGRRVEWIFRDL